MSTTQEAAAEEATSPAEPVEAVSPASSSPAAATPASPAAASTAAALAREVRVRDALIHEVHHRVKNNLQTVESLMRLHIRRCDSPEARNVLEEASCRLRAMSVVHEMLSEATAEEVDVVELARKVVTQVKLGLCGDTEAFAVAVRGAPRAIPGSLATSLALVVAEISHNSFEHGFAGRERGSVAVEFAQGPDCLRVTLQDDGCGLPAGFSLEAPASMGLTLMKALVEDDLHGELDGLRERMETRRAIDQAKCLLMEQGLSEEEAFTRLRKASMVTRKPGGGGGAV